MTSLALVVGSYFDGQRHHDRGPYTIEIVDGVVRAIHRGDISGSESAGRTDGTDDMFPLTPGLSLGEREKRAPAMSQSERVGLHNRRATIPAAHGPTHPLTPSLSPTGGEGARRAGEGERKKYLHAPFVMPGLVEAHCHLFLEGAELDLKRRKDYLHAPFDEMLAVGRRSLAQNLAAGITLIRDAGDLHGINTRLKTELAGQTGVAPELRSPGRALRKAGRYGSFMAVEVTDADSIVRTMLQLAPTADDLKVLLTGIIDFEKGCMKGGLQFSLEETKLIVRTARELGLRTYAHCSGVEGLRVAVEAGIDSIEHGFFMERDILRAMADQGIAWVPTFSPVYFQYARPELAGWNKQTVAGLWRILENHFEHVALASELGVIVVAGSDAGSYGVPHGQGLIDELLFQHRAGMPLDKVLASATSVPRRLWRCTSADVVSGNRANLLVLEASPFQDIQNLRRLRCVIRGSDYYALERNERGFATRSNALTTNN